MAARESARESDAWNPFFFCAAALQTDDAYLFGAGRGGAVFLASLVRSDFVATIRDCASLPARPTTLTAACTGAQSAGLAGRPLEGSPLGCWPHERR